jgi:gas vesicle protein
MFQRVCGSALKNAVLVTTCWDVVGDEKAVDLEQQLVKDELRFKPLCNAGATPFGHNNTRGSARRIMNKLLNNNPIVLQMQEELETGMTLEETAAGAELSADLSATIKKHKAEIKKLREEMKEARKAKDRAWQKELNDELARLKENVERLAASKEQLTYVHFFDAYTTSLKRFSESSKSNMWQRFMRAG